METVKKEDLRIGNDIKLACFGKGKLPKEDAISADFGYRPYKVNAYVLTSLEINPDFAIKPIPLTEDILVRLGFEEQMFGTIKTDAYKKGIITVHLISGNTGECQIALYNKLLPIFYNYVHEL